MVAAGGGGVGMAVQVQQAGWPGCAVRPSSGSSFPSLFVTVRRSWATWAAPSNSFQAGARTVLMVRWAQWPWSAVTAETAGGAAGGAGANRALAGRVQRVTQLDSQVPTPWLTVVMGST